MGTPRGWGQEGSALNSIPNASDSLGTSSAGPGATQPWGQRGRKVVGGKGEPGKESTALPEVLFILEKNAFMGVLGPGDRDSSVLYVVQPCKAGSSHSFSLPGDESAVLFWGNGLLACKLQALMTQKVRRKTFSGAACCWGAWGGGDGVPGLG